MARFVLLETPANDKAIMLVTDDRDDQDIVEDMDSEDWDVVATIPVDPTGVDLSKWRDVENKIIDVDGGEE